MHSVLVLAVVAAGPQFPLPPSAQWEAREDPAPAPEAAEPHFFVWKADPNVRLRVGTMRAMKHEYTSSFIVAIATRMGMDARAAGTPLKVLEADTFDVGGVPVGKLRTVDGPIQALMFWLPGHDGDVIVSLMVVHGAWNADAEGQVAKAVAAATNLRGAAPSMDEAADRASSIAGGVVAALVLAGGALALLFRNRGRSNTRTG